MAGKSNPHRQAFDDLGISKFEELPHIRSDAVGLRSLDLADLKSPTEEQEDKYWNLLWLLECDEEIVLDYRTFRAALAQYITHALPFPRELQGYWTLSALPGTPGGRLSTLSVRGTEVLIARPQTFGMILADRKGLRKQLEDHGVDRKSIENASYAALGGLQSIRFFCSVDSALSLVYDDQILDAAYAACRELMIHGKRGLNWKDHNAALAADVLLSGSRSGEPSD